MKAVKTHLSQNQPDKVDEFEKGAQAYAKKIVANFKDFDFVSRVNESTLDFHNISLVHRRKHESRRYGCSFELPRA